MIREGDECSNGDNEAAIAVVFKKDFDFDRTLAIQGTNGQ
jgi:hypothetical protein